VFKSEEEEQLKTHPPKDMRDKSGLFPTEKPKRGSYAEDRLQELQRERDKYNVNHLGYYKGGLPQKGKGNIRGKALGRPQDFHSPEFHNFLHNYHQDSTFVNSEDAIKFKNWMTSDIVDFQTPMPYYKTYYDRSFEFMRDRSYFLGLISFIFMLMYAGRRYQVERARFHQIKRVDHLDEIPKHHLNNRGGVLLEKEFLGFEKYFKNDAALTEWYKRVYPGSFQEKPQEE